MNPKKVVVYVVIPVALSSLLIGMYFSGNITLQRIVSPKLPPMSPDAWREFGLLENLQNLVLLGILAVACAGVARKRPWLEKAAWVVFAAGVLFVFLEEIDYGAHIKAFLSAEGPFPWFEPMSQWPPDLLEQTDFASRPANVHNQPGVDKVFKKAGDLVIFGLFVLLPLAVTRIRSPWIRYFAPDKYAILTVLAMVILSCVTHGLGDREESVVRSAVAMGDGLREAGSVSRNLSEFRELSFYYLLLVCCSEIVFLRRSPGMESERAPERIVARRDAQA